MAELTPELVANIQGMMANVETAYRQVNRAKTALSALMNAGRATCNDVKTYNLQVKAVYAYQASVASIIRANGGAVPPIPPPVYVAYKGIAGDQAINIDCSSAQMRGPDGVPAVFVRPDQVEWREGATSSDTAVIQQLTAAAQAAVVQGNQTLGAAPLLAAIPIIIVGIVVVVAGYIVLKIVEALKDVPAKRETTRQIAIQAEQHSANLEKREKCYADCASRGGDPIACAKSCDRLIPSFSPTLPGGGWGVIGTIIGIGIIGLVGYAGYQAWQGGMFDASRYDRRRSLPRGKYEIDRDNAIDADYAERAA